MIADISGISRRSTSKLTADITAGDRDEADQAKDLIPVVCADGDSEAPASRIQTRLSGGLTQ